MSEHDLASILHELRQILQSHNYEHSRQLLSRAKITLLHLDALVPTPTTSGLLLQAAREALELGALISIRLQDPPSFTRYFLQLQPFYEIPASRLPRENSQRSKVTGLYLLLLLSQGDYAGFHTLLEGLEMMEEGRKVEDDRFIEYPISLERSLMEGSYDKVWRSTKSDSVPSEEYALFSDILVGTIRSEIASCSEKAYPSLPITNAKNLFFLESEGAVVDFARERGWVAKDGRIFFPEQEDKASERDILQASRQVVENTIGYARELEMIV